MINVQTETVPTSPARPRPECLPGQCHVSAKTRALTSSCPDPSGDADPRVDINTRQSPTRPGPHLMSARPGAAGMLRFRARRCGRPSARRHWRRLAPIRPPGPHVRQNGQSVTFRARRRQACASREALSWRRGGVRYPSKACTRCGGGRRTVGHAHVLAWPQGQRLKGGARRQ
jgi:hypothetical protein